MNATSPPGSPLVGAVAVWVVSPSASLRRALGEMVERQPSLLLAGESATVQAARRALREKPPQILISSVPPGSAQEIELWREVRDLGVRIIVMSPNVNGHDAMLSVLAGASAVLELGVERGSWLMSRIDEVAHGRAELPAGLVQRLSELAASRRRSPLAPEERRLLTWLLTDEPLPAIAEAIHADVRSLRASLAGICDKLACSLPQS